MIPLIFLLSAPVQAAEGEVWTAAEVEVEASKAVSLEVAQHLRMGMTPLDSAEALTDLGASFEVFEHLELGAAYRLGFVDLGDKPETRHRLAFDATVPLKVEGLKLSLRERYQLRVGTDHNSERHVFRTRLAAKLKSEALPVQPFVSTEPFVELGLGLTKWRNSAGVDVPIGEHKLSLFYRMDLAMPATEDPTVHIAGLAFKFDVPRARPRGDGE
ncbi:MAG: DUF2490 domain-containing protein [Deltaproteobacteria bacterium]|nr:MAG: DUF2490 domain-containing protein [Deltaproteobacteria bacterium]